MRGRVGKTAPGLGVCSPAQTPSLSAPPLRTHHNTGMGSRGDAVRERP